MSRNAALLLVIVIALLAVGLVMLASATGIAAERSARHQDAYYFFKRQLVWLVVSAAALTVTALVPYGVWARWRWPILAASAALLAAVLVPGIGAELNGARRWIRGGGLFLQPSEAAKLGVAVFLAAFAAADPERLKRLFSGFLPAFGILGLVCGLILVEPDVGTAVFTATVMSLMLFVAGARPAHLVSVGAVAGGAMAWLVLTRMPHVIRRLQDFQSSYQILQAKLAWGSGGWTGRGLGDGTSKLYFLPEVQSDFIFPVIGEELGFLGAAGVMFLYAGLGLAGYRIMRRAPDRFGFLLSFAITTSIILQAAMNVAVVTAAIPTKGIPLPFVSAGGSSLLFAMAGVGMLVSVANAAERGTCPDGYAASCSPVAEPAATSSQAWRSPSMP